ncbi:GntR family transcriptional regulator [Microbacterium sp. cx-55]|uniref:GntR family transcriptional regulator n=1 Tax=unclassified Microbacterium TaxID=2609290 RepID=UPI001CBF5895|nr:MULTISPECIES: GntR family transcriptional regulator [unclassified Microbacterium]MBZ4486642.1 GntR family transcriptional regulator [Microbacterium sp. cx-55]MCC4907609.1 GntR family transcriptional regulator [Microbacterium sp. cx-59]UGB36393.1 GntR family transcriptional regulator [Microbacterium sp. cx-55]
MPPLPLRIDSSSSVAPFEQLRSGVIAAIAAGTLAPGERLPTVRALAERLDIAPGTAARAYRELEGTGVIETRGRAGTFVSLAADPALRQAQAAAADFVARIRLLGLTDDDARELLAAALHATRD